MDGRTIRIIAFCFVFLGTFVTLLALVPNQFVVSTKQYAGFEDKVPDAWNGIDLQRYNLTEAWNFTLTSGISDAIQDFSVGGRNLRLVYSHIPATGTKLMRLFHRYGIGLLWLEAMDWYNKGGFLRSYQHFGAATINAAILNEDYESYNGLEYSVVCLGKGAGSSYFKIITLFAWNTISYPTPESAWDNNALDILVGITWDYASSAMDAWFLVTSLLTFNTVEVFGNSAPESIAVNVILAFPFLVCIIIPAALFLLEVLDRIIPF